MIGTLCHRLYIYYILMPHCNAGKKDFEQENWNLTNIRFKNLANSGISYKFWRSGTNKRWTVLWLSTEARNIQSDRPTDRETDRQTEYMHTDRQKDRQKTINRPNRKIRGRQDMPTIETYVNIKQLQLPHGISVYPPNTNSFSRTMVTVFSFPSQLSWNFKTKCPCEDWR